MPRIHTMTQACPGSPMPARRRAAEVIYCAERPSPEPRHHRVRMNDISKDSGHTIASGPVPAGDSVAMTARREFLNQLLLAVAQEDRTAFAELYRLTASRLFGVIVRMVRDRAEAEDLLQDVFVSVWRRAHAFDDGRGNAMTWLTALARNRTIDRLRETRETHLDDAEDPDPPSEDPTPAALAEASEQRRLLEECLQRLDRQPRAAVREAFFGGSSYSELAARLDVPEGTMKSWIRRSLLQLKRCLEQ